MDSRRLELTGACLDPQNVLCTVGLKGPVDATLVQGRITVRNGRLATLDEKALSAKAYQKVLAYLGL